MASHTLRRRTTYRATGRHIRRGPHPIFRAVVVLLVGFTMFTSGASAATIFLYGDSLPSLKDFKNHMQFQNTVIRDRFGHVLYDMADVSAAGRGRRVVEPLKMPGHTTAVYRASGEDWLVGNAPSDHGIPVILQNATIATEDATFYSNPGFDVFSIVRAGYDDLTKGHIVSGASTITQQLIKRYLLRPDPTVSRKAEEILLAAELTQKYPKSKILWYYLNSISYGNLSIGAEAAAKTYFNTDVWNLDLAQSALLAGLPEAPSIYDPVNNRPAALARMRMVLHLMYIHGYLKDAQGHPDPSLITAAMKEAQKWKFTPPSVTMKYPLFVKYAVNQLQSIPQLQGKIYNGLDVTTTLDPRLQDEAQQTVTNQISQLGGYNVTDGALVSIDLRPDCRGCVMAMVGSAHVDKGSVDINMADTPRQPGSSFKPFNYIYAFQHGLAPGTSVLDGPIAIPDGNNWYEPTDYDHMWHGPVTLRVALQNSLNVPAVKVEQYGASVAGGNLRASVANQAIKMGVTSLFQDNPHCCGWSLTLGGLESGIRLVQETAAYGTMGSPVLDRLGWTAPPTAILLVRDRTTGKILFDARKDRTGSIAPQPVVAPQYAYEMDNVLSDNNSRCTPTVCEFGFDSPLNLGRPAAAKTGTTNSFTDNWTVGFTPDLVTGVWVGNTNYSPMVGTTGVTGAAPIWHDYMVKALDTLQIPPMDFPEPSSGVYFGTSCRIPGAYTSYSTMGYDIYAGDAPPYCSVGSYDTSVPIPQDTNTYQQPSTQTYTQPAPPPVAAPTASVPGVQPGVQPSSGQTVQSAPVQQAPTPAPAAQPPTPQPVATQPPAAQPPAQQPPSQQAPAQQPPAQQAPAAQAPVQQAPAQQPAPATQPTP